MKLRPFPPCVHAVVISLSKYEYTMLHALSAVMIISARTHLHTHSHTLTHLHTITPPYVYTLTYAQLHSHTHQPSLSHTPTHTRTNSSSSQTAANLLASCPKAGIDSFLYIFVLQEGKVAEGGRYYQSPGSNEGPHPSFGLLMSKPIPHSRVSLQGHCLTP